MQSSDQPQAQQQHMEGADPPSDEQAVKRTGRRKINIEFIQDKARRNITFSKRKAGIIKKAYELSTLTGTQVLLLVASETGHVYTFATPKLQPIITRPEGKNLIQSCLNSTEDELYGEAESSQQEQEHQYAEEQRKQQQQQEQAQQQQGQPPQGGQYGQHQYGGGGGYGGRAQYPSQPIPAQHPYYSGSPQYPMNTRMVGQYDQKDDPQ